MGKVKIGILSHPRFRKEKNKNSNKCSMLFMPGNCMLSNVNNPDLLNLIPKNSNQLCPMEKCKLSNLHNHEY